MLELLFILSLVGWAVISFLEFLGSLEAFPTIVVASLAVPIACRSTYRKLQELYGVSFLRDGRPMLPPERFQWTVCRRRMGRHLIFCAGGAVLASAGAIALPASFGITTISVAGWLSGAMAIALLSVSCVQLAIYFKGSQSYDRYSPRFVGWLRRGMFYLSDNYEFLGEEPEARRRREGQTIY